MTMMTSSLFSAAAEPIQDVWAVLSSTHPRPDDEDRADLLELFAGKARITEAFAKRKGSVLRPRDIVFGHDLRCRQQQEDVLDEVLRERPRLVWAAPPCTAWCSYARLNFTAQERRRRQAREVTFLHFLDRVLQLQHDLGGHLIVENPRTSEIWRHHICANWLRDPRHHEVNLDMCCYNMTTMDGSAKLKKPLKLFTTHPGFGRVLEKHCDGSHEHGRTEGDNTAHSAHYTTAFGTAVYRALHEVLRQGGSDRSTHGVYALEDGKGEAEDNPPGNRAAREGDAVGAEVITFRGKVNPGIAAALRRIHQNLGHPPNRELIRHLRLSGANAAMVQAAQQLSCRACARCTKTKPYKVASPAVYFDFNDAVAMDIIWLETSDSDGANIPALNIVDFASTFQQVVPLKSTKSADTAEAFVSGWVAWAGCPKHVTVDLDSAFKDQFLDEMDKRQVAVRCAAGQAHWQNGLAERHGSSWKSIWSRVVEATGTLKEEVNAAVVEVNNAKNVLRNRSGYSPRQWVFGSGGRADNFHDDPDAVDIASPDTKFGRIQALRLAAKSAFFETQVKDVTQRALSHKARVDALPYEPGSLVYYHRLVRPGKGKKPKSVWLGPATVIGREGSNYWLARGGRCLLVAPEHLRPASHDEVSELLRTKVALHELQQMLKNDDAVAEDDDSGLEDASGEQRGTDGEGGDVQMEVEEELDGGVPVDARTEEVLAREKDLETTRRRKNLLDDVPIAMKKFKGPSAADNGTNSVQAASSTGSESVYMATRRCSERGKAKQLEKEIPWEMIPPKEKHLYRQAEKDQWDEHVKYNAVKPLSVAESQEVREQVDPSRILRARFAYKDKNHSLRKADPTVPPKPKARLCVAGHRDPDLGRKDMAVDAPTAGRHSLLLAIQLALAKEWVASIGDIRAAFLNGVQAPRQLYFEQPRRGIPTLEPGTLVEILKGVFGLSTSPKLWWMRLSGELNDLSFDYRDEKVFVRQNDVDPCIFMIIGEKSGEVFGVILTHVDDLLLLTEEGLRKPLQDVLAEKFPVDGWQNDSFEYIGCKYVFSKDKVEVSQEHYADARVDNVGLLEGQKDGDIPTQEQVEENRTSIGSLSWLAKQTRPDLQFNVSCCQRAQNNPEVADLKFTNKVVREAKDHKDKTLVIRRVELDDLAFYAFHDAAWGNVPDPNAEEDDARWLGDHKISSQLAYLVLVASKDAIKGRTSEFSTLDWKSKASSRTCRSTFAGETMACGEAMEATLFLRALFVSMRLGRSVKDDEAAKYHNLHLLTDCRSLYDHIHREGTPKAPADKRLAVDLADIRQTLMREARHQWHQRYGDSGEQTPDKPFRPPLHWIPTEDQLADMLTKSMRADQWWAVCEAGFLTLPLKDRS